VRILKNRSGNNRHLVMASRALVQHRANRPGFEIAATSATEPIRPSQFMKISSAAFFRRKPTFKLSQVCGVFSHTHGHYMLYGP
jgi:hypothetical protein